MEQSSAAGPADRKFVLICGVLPAVLIVALAIYRPAFLSQLDYRVYDAMMRAAAAARASDSAVTIVDIDERSVNAVGQWPWRREVIADLVTRAHDLGAAVVALDMFFAEPDRYEQSAASALAGSSDATLAAALRKGRVVVGYAMTFDSASSQSNRCVLHPLTLPILQPAGDDVPVGVARATGAICSLPTLATEAGASGFLNAAPDGDGILRRVPLLIEYQDRLHPGLALAAVLAARGRRDIALRLSDENTSSLIVDDRPITLDGKGNLLMRFRGRDRAYPYVSAADLLQGKAQPEQFRNAVVFVGATALGTGDEVSTPFGTRTPGVEIQATVADNLLRHDFIRRPDYASAIEIASVLGLGVLIAALVARSGLMMGVVTGAVAVIVLWAGARWLFSSNGVHLSPVFPIAGVVTSLAAATVAKLCQERMRANLATTETEVTHRLMIQSLLSLTEIRDAETGSHSRRTQRYSRVLAVQLREHPRFREYLTPQRIDLLSQLAPLHDIGKVGVPDHLLNKAGELTPDEYGEMKKHPVYGLDVITTAERQVGAHDDAILAMAKEIVYTHHERWDGKGYPRGLIGEQIPIPGRLIALVDVYDALTTRRRYRAPLTHDEAVDVIVGGTGTHFDPAVVDAFLRTASVLRSASSEVDGVMTARVS
jgi:HD-GYP domain-containing protein (c-di-GMP phosphodiesterase class II)